MESGAGKGCSEAAGSALGHGQRETVEAAGSRRHAYIHLHSGADLESAESPRLLRELPGNEICTRKRRIKRPYAIRKPKEYRVRKPRDIVQADTLDVRPLLGVIFKQFQARDMDSRWDVVEVCRNATAGNARKFLETLMPRTPFPV